MSQAERLEKYCREAKERLVAISGRVLFVDDNGEAVKVTEQERGVMAKELEKDINERCKP